MWTPYVALSGSGHDRRAEEHAGNGCAGGEFDRLRDDGRARIEVGSPLFSGEQALRDAVLRAPLGRVPSATMIDRDRTGRHFVALAGGTVIGCVGLYPGGLGTAVLRYLAVAEDARRQGVARQLVAFAEARVARDGVRQVEAEARLEAIPFYEAAGYTALGDVYRHGVSHRAVSKRLGEAIVDRP